MIKRTFIYSLLVMLLAVTGLRGQTTNSGVLYVSKDTKFSTVERFDNKESGEFYNDGEAFIYSHFNNDGILDYYGETGFTQFVGNAVQQLTGTKVSYLYDVFFNNNSRRTPFELSGALDISGISDFYQGIVDNDNFGGSITFSRTGSHANTSNESHVDGMVYKAGSDKFTFPIGDGGFYRFAGSSELNAPSLYTAKFFYENSDALYPHSEKVNSLDAIDHQEYWRIEKEADNKDDILITLSWSNDTTPSEFIAAAAQKALTVVRWNEASNRWINEGGNINMDNQTVTTAVTGYGIYTFGILNEADILPCGLTVYNAVTPNGDGIHDSFVIDAGQADCIRDLKVQIFNRWGVKVFESNNYGENGEVFKGYSTGRLTVNGSRQLPTGTYFYMVDYEYGDPSANTRYKQTGYLYLITD